MRLAIFLFALTFLAFSFSQRGKDGDYTTSVTGEILNSYTYLTNDASNGNTSITVQDASMNNTFFGGTLGPGDLIFIHQLQGANLFISTYPISSWGWDNTFPLDSTWGAANPLDYNNSGNYEFVEVASVTGNTITLNCGLQKSYSTAGHVVIVRVPRFNDLTVASGTSITAANWDGDEGGEVILEVDGELDIETNGEIEANGKGFRGGQYENASGSGFYGLSAWGIFTTERGARKGEGAGGYVNEYSASNYQSPYGKGAPANGGGGGNGHNAGGGGGANAGFGTYYSGKGVPDPTYSASWDLEYVGFAGNPSIGGGRGGYTSSGNSGNPEVRPPGNTSWDSDYRRDEGGRGGHLLDYSSGRIWFGGGGGAGDGNDNDGGSGGAGGGLVYIMAYGNFIGSGNISANGEDGEDSQGSPPGGGSISGDDGAGGAGAGGLVMINSVANIPNALTISANGGTGGDNLVLFGAGTSTPPFANNFACGPGGGGGGGYVSTSVGSPTITAFGGQGGTTTGLPFDTEFPFNGSTAGANGITGGSLTPFDLIVDNDTLCGPNNSYDLTTRVSQIGSLPSGATGLTWWDSQFGGNTVSSTQSISTTTTFYVGTCPGTFRKPITIVVSPPINITGTAVITNTTCNGSTGSITGLSASGGTGTLVLDWNGTVTAGADLLNASPGSYTLTVTDENGCTGTSGPYTISSISGPTIDSLNYILSPESCTGGDGSITGIAVSGTNPLTYTWNSTVYGTADINDATTGVYWLYVEDGNNCIDSTGPYNMTQVGGPVIDSLNYIITNSACNGSTGGITGITATGAATLTYEWNGIASADPDLINAGVGLYTLVVTDGNGCKDSTGIYMVGQQNPPVIDSVGFALDSTACASDNGAITGISVTGNSPFTYEWNGVVSVSADLSGAGVGMYTLVVTDANGCVDSTGVYSIAEELPPVLDTLGYGIVNTSCDVDDGTITGISVSGNGPHTYEWNGVSSTGPDASGLGLGTYTLVVTDVNGCVDSTGIYTINQQTPPILDTTGYATSDRSCQGNDGTITGISVTGNAPFQYFWNGISSAGINATGLDVGNYTLVVVDDNGCSDTTGVYAVGQAADPMIDTTNMTIVPSDCNVNTGEVSGIVVTGSMPFQYFWDGVQATLDQNGLAPGLHDLVVVDGNGCDDTLVGINIGTLNGPIIDDTGLILGNDHCLQGIGSVNGILVSDGTPGYSYLWSNGGTNLDILGLDSGTYQLTVTDAAGCTALYGPVNIGNTPGPVVVETSLTVTDDFCDLGNGIITGITANGEAPFSYLWSNGDTTLALVGLTQGTYSLTVTDNFGCSATSSDITVGNSNPNPVDFSWTPDPITSTGQTVTFTATNTTGISYEWLMDDSLVASNVNPLDIVIENSGVYSVCYYLYGQGGCDDSICYTITVSGSLIIPNVITPNGDGTNEKFVIEGLIPNTSVTIFNRWGNKVFETDSYDNQWSGMDMRGLQVSDGEYFYVITDPMDETYQGSLRIISK